MNIETARGRLVSHVSEGGMFAEPVLGFSESDRRVVNKDIRGRALCCCIAVYKQTKTASLPSLTFPSVGIQAGWGVAF